MAGGPILPNSVYPLTTGNVFPMIYAGGGGNSVHDQGLGVAASIGADSTWEVRYPLPPTIPSGTCKLRFLALANATAGTAIVQVMDAVVAVGSSPSAASLTAETSGSITWSSGDADKYKELKVTLTPTMVGNNMLIANLVYKTLGWTLAAGSCWIVTLIWE